MSLTLGGGQCTRFAILGGIEAEADGRRLLLGGPCEQKVLAVLLLDAGRTVPVSRLVDALWEDDPPVTARKQVRNAVSRLRKLLAPRGSPALIVTDGAGYRLPVADGALDAHLFKSRLAQASAAASRGQVAQAAALIRSALELWRGPALAGLDGRVIEAMATAWEERRRAAQETYYDHMLTLGQHQLIVPDLSAQVADEPLRERLAAQLMLALSRCGRQADALQVHERIRRVLASELGLDPGAELQRLHRQILTGDPYFPASPGRSRRASPATPGETPRRASVAASAQPARPAASDGSQTCPRLSSPGSRRPRHRT